MEFHISCHHTPGNCAVHRSEPALSPKSWAEHCKEVGVTHIKGGPQHSHFIFVETDEMAKLRDFMQPFLGYWDVVTTPVRGLR